MKLDFWKNASQISRGNIILLDTTFPESPHQEKSPSCSIREEEIIAALSAYDGKTVRKMIAKASIVSTIIYQKFLFGGAGCILFIHPIFSIYSSSLEEISHEYSVKDASPPSSPGELRI